MNTLKKTLIIASFLLMNVNLFAQLSGTYTIGGTSPDYNTITDAINAMESQGTYHQVVFNIRAGTYNETLIIPNITTATSLYNITFQSETGDTDVVVNNIDSMFTVKFDTARYFVFKNIKFKTENQNYHNKLIFFNNASTIEFHNCMFDGGPSVNYRAEYLCYSVEDSICLDNSVFDSCYFRNATNAINFTGKANNFDDQTYYMHITNSVFTSIYHIGIKINNYKYITINNNRVNLYNINDGEGISISNSRSINIYKNTITNNQFIAHSGISLWNDSTYCNIQNNIISNYNEGIQIYNVQGVSGQNMQIVNNMITAAKYTGLWIENSNYYKIYNNSIKAPESLHLQDENNYDIKNNILDGSLFVNSCSAITSDYNDLYNDTNNVGNWAGTNCSTLSDWQTASGQDANSVSVNPDFISATDLHTYSIEINNKGTGGLIILDINQPATGFTTDVSEDIDDETRNSSTPDIGADEFSPNTTDVSVIELITVTSGCDLTSTEDVRIKVVNNGTDLQTAIPVRYTIDGGATYASETITNLASGDTTEYTFTTKADFSVPNEYTCIAFTDLAGDQRNSNDTLSNKTYSYGSISSYPFNEDFEQNMSNYFKLFSNSDANVSLNSSAANNSNYGLLFAPKNGSHYSSWQGGDTPDSTQLWVDNVYFHAFAKSCNINLAGLSNPAFQFDSKIFIPISSYHRVWFRVLVNDTIVLKDVNGNSVFHAEKTQSFANTIFRLNDYLNQNINLTIQSCIFNSFQDASDNPQVYIDNIAIGERPTIDLGADIEFCNGDSATIDAGSGTGYTYAWFNTGSSDTLGTNQTLKVFDTGTYFVNVYSNAGIVNSDTINITANPTYFYSEQQAICNNDSILWHGNYYNTAGTYYDSLQTTTGCDSIYELQLQVNPTYFYTEQQTICDNDSLLWHGNYYNVTGTYYDSLQTTTACDSIYELQLSTNPTYFYTEQQAICDNDSVLWHGNYYNIAGTYYDSLQTTTGCDSIYELQLSTNPTYFYTEQQTICDNDSLLWHGKYYNLTGIYYDSLQTTTGCDSIYELQLQVNPTYFYTEQQTICDNDNLLWHGNYYSMQGTYYDSLQTATACDSIYELQLFTNPTYNFNDTLETCQGDSVYWRGNYYSQSGTYYDSLQTILGCDSVYTLQFITNPNYYYTNQINSCDDTVSWHGNNYTTAGIYYDSLQTTTGCDSIYEVQINFNQKYRFVEYDTLCDVDWFYWHGQFINSSGTYYDNLTTQAGCDSIFEYHYTKAQSTQTQESISICEGESYSWHGNIYNVAGSYYDTLQTVLGCDSICKLTIGITPLPTGIIYGKDTARYGDTINYYISTYDNIDSWNIENGTIINYIKPTSINVVWDTIGTGTIYAVINNQNCSDTIHKQVYITSTVGINELVKNEDIDIYPNPTKDYLYIDYDKPFFAEIYNILGKKVFETKKSKINMYGFDNGYYILKIKNKNNRVIKIIKIIKE